ncbi:hypothetical protein HH310_33985 [Actinoplanes sp. TBRC 11911]|uniref:hypothetical protein n=1 Tax=Actinoplanes sp. TBRC 11911 TaxID=2729386 RepID=UPI00145F94D6|nr:hypothetical protein [Actinoplanes sp. TBRC 11911]NMO56176.1 hypothetical protein [Actinoplanes sp. TBRC 11911]
MGLAAGERRLTTPDESWRSAVNPGAPFRRPLPSNSATGVPTPQDADPRYVRQGRICALTNGQNAQAETRLQRQSTTKVDDYFADATGQVASNVVTLPY